MLLLTLITILDPINGDFLALLMEKHGDTLFSAAYSKLKDSGTGTREDAEELVQETFLKVYRHIERFHGISEDETKKLLIVYTKNTVKDYLKKAEHRYKKVSFVYEEDSEEKSYELPDTDMTPEEIVISKETIEQTHICIEQLSEEQRQIIYLKYYHGYKNKEIAQVLGISETNVSSRLNRAKAALRKMRKEKNDG